jgi:hypothetical protein
VGALLAAPYPNDLRPLHALAVKVWGQLGIPVNTSVARFRALREQRFRIVVLWDGDALPAALIAHPIEAVRGPGYEIKAFIVDQARADKIKLLDAISMYACNIAAAEGRRVVVSARPKAVTGVVYGRDVLRMHADDRPTEVYQTGDAQAIIKNILDRRPEWRLP